LSNTIIGEAKFVIKINSNLNKAQPIMRLRIANAFALLTLLTVVGCVGSVRQATYVSSKSYIGMPISEFKTIAKSKASLEAMESGYTVYRVNDYIWETGEIIDTKFYYFNQEGKLIKIDGGEFKKKRYQIEIL
jgi:hypothetical protein